MLRVQKPSADVLVTLFEGQPIEDGLRLAAELRQAGLRGRALLARYQPVALLDILAAIDHRIAIAFDPETEMEPIAIRRKCKQYAEKFVKLQKGQMQRLLTMADYDDPYLTMSPAYEADIVETFAARAIAAMG